MTMDGKSLDTTAELYARLKALMPDVFAEEKTDCQLYKTTPPLVQCEHYPRLCKNPLSDKLSERTMLRQSQFSIII